MAGVDRVRAGDLDRRIVIQRPVLTRSAPIFEAIPSWENLVTTTTDGAVYASKKPAGARERIVAGERGAEADTVFVVRWSNLVRTTDPTFRILHDGVTYEILGVEEIGRREGIRLICVARNEGGMPALRY
jgi:head-tail adaptor